MYKFPRYIQSAIDEISKLPNIGPKSAARLVFWLLTQPASEKEKLAGAIRGLIASMVFCQRCRNYSSSRLCEICRDPNRASDKLCVVESPFDVIALERTNFNSRYFVLGKLLSPLEGIGPEHLPIRQLVALIKKDLNLQEVIIATSPSLEGETTASFLAKLLKPAKVKISRLARGVPSGSELEYTDEVTLRAALEGRTSLK